MIITNVNEKGRVYINKYEFKKIANEIVYSKSNKFRFIEIKIDSKEIYLTLKALEDYNSSKLNEIRDAIKDVYRKRFGYEVLQFDIEIL